MELVRTRLLVLSPSLPLFLSLCTSARRQPAARKSSRALNQRQCLRREYSDCVSSAFIVFPFFPSLFIFHLCPSEWLDYMLHATMSLSVVASFSCAMCKREASAQNCAALSSPSFNSGSRSNNSVLVNTKQMFKVCESNRIKTNRKGLQLEVDGRCCMKRDGNVLGPPNSQFLWQDLSDRVQGLDLERPKWHERSISAESISEK